MPTIDYINRFLAYNLTRVSLHLSRLSPQMATQIAYQPTTLRTLAYSCRGCAYIYRYNSTTLPIQNTYSIIVLNIIANTHRESTLLATLRRFRFPSVFGVFKGTPNGILNMLFGRFWEQTPHGFYM